MTKFPSFKVNQKTQQILTLLSTNKKDSLKNYLAKGTIGLFSLKIASTGLGFISSIILARLLGSDGLGIYAYAFAWANLLSIPATLGLDKLLVREIAIYQAQSSWALMGGILKWANQMVLIVSVSLALVAGGIAWYLNIDSRQTMVWAIWIVLIALPLNSLRNLRSGAMQGLHKVVTAMLPEFFVSPLLLIFIICFWKLLGTNDNTVLWILAIRIILIGISFIMGAIWLYQSLPLEVKEFKLEYKVKDWLRSSFPFMFLGVMELVNTQADILMLGAIKGVEEVGVYDVVIRITFLVIFIQGSVNNVLGPTISSLYARREIKQLQKIITQTSRVVLLISLTITSILIGFSYWILMIFGSEFTQGQNALIILCIGKLVNAAMGPSGLLLNMTGRENYTFKTFLFSASLNLVLNALMIPEWGINGAATATAVSTITSNVINMILVRKKIQISPTAWR
jgi:O-antigen/teichoic acid export membrane protein